MFTKFRFMKVLKHSWNKKMQISKNLGTFKVPGIGKNHHQNIVIRVDRAPKGEGKCYQLVWGK